MKNTEIHDKFVKNAISTYNYDKILEKALRNPALGMPKNTILEEFFKAGNSRALFAKVCAVLTTSITDNPSTLNLGQFPLNSKQVSILNTSTQDISPQITPQEVFIALAYKHLRENLLSSNKRINDQVYFTLNKDLPLTYDFTLTPNLTQFEQIGYNTFNERGILRNNPFFTLEQNKIYTSVIYRNANQEVVRIDSSESYIYSESETYSVEGAEPIFLPCGEVGFSWQMVLEGKYGVPSKEEIVTVVGRAKGFVGEVLRTKPLFTFKLEGEAFSNILNSLFILKSVVLTDDTYNTFLESLDFEEIFDYKAKYQVGVLLSEGTASDPKISVSIPADGFFMVLQVAQNLQRTQFKVKRVGEKYVLDFSYEEEKIKSTWVYEEGIPVERIEKILEIVPAYYVFNDNVCVSNISAVFYCQEQNYEITSQKIIQKESAIKPLISLPLSILRRSVIINNRAIVLDSLYEWSKVQENFYSDGLAIAQSHVDKYTKIEKNKISGLQFRKYKQEIFDDTLKAVKSIKGIDSQSAIDRYVWSIEQKYWDLNPSFDVKRTLHYFLGIGISLESALTNPYRILCARLLGIDYYYNYDKVVIDALSDDNSEVFIDAFYLLNKQDYSNMLNVDNAKNLKLFTDCVRNKSEFVNQNLYLLQKSVKDELFKLYLSAIGIIDVEKVIQNHLSAIQEYLPKEVKFHFEKSDTDYQVLVKKNTLGSPYKQQEQGDYQIEDDVEASEKVSNIDYERRRIVLPIGNKAAPIDRQFKFADSSFLPDDFSYGAVGSSLNGMRLIEILAENHVRPNDVKIMMLQAGVKIESTELGIEGDAYTKTVQFNVLDKFVKKIDLRGNPTEYGIEINGFVEFRNPNSMQYLPPSGKISLGLMPTKKSLWKFQEPYLWIDYQFILSELKKAGLMQENENYIPLDIAELVVSKVENDYNTFSGYSQTVGDEMFTLDKALNNMEDIEKEFNLLYNNLADKAQNGYSDAPIFVEYSRLFSRNKFEFSFRPAQLQGLRFLNGKNNTGVLAHEVGFGKTTTAIAKISDWFLRGEASRVLVVAPTEEVYSKWFDEIKGNEFSIGVLGEKVNVVPLGNLLFDALRGKPTGDDYVKKSDYGEYDGCFDYNKSQTSFVKESQKIGNKISKTLGGRGQRLTSQAKKSTEWIFENMKSLHILLDEIQISRNLLDLPKYPSPVRWSKSSNVKSDAVVVSFSNRTPSYYNFVTQKIVAESSNKFIPLSAEGQQSENSFFGLILKESKSLIPNITNADLANIYQYFTELEVKYQTSVRDKDKDAKFVSASPKIKFEGNALTIVAPPNALNYIEEIEPYTESKKPEFSEINNLYNLRENVILALRLYTLNVIAYILSNGQKGSVKTPSYVGAQHLIPHIRRTLFNMGTSEILSEFYNNKSISEVLSDGRVFASAADKIERLFDPISVDVKYSPEKNVELSFKVDYKDIYKDLALENYKSAAELEMTSEIVEILRKFNRISPAIGVLKPVAKKDKTIFVCLKTAIGKFKVPYEFAVDAALRQSDFPKGEGIIVSDGAKKAKFVEIYDDKDLFYLSNRNYAALASNRLNAINISRFVFDAIVVDEVHNFNRGYKKASNLVVKYKENKDAKIKYRQRRTTLPKRKPEDNQFYAVQTFEASANYNLQADVQNFGAICNYIRKVAENKYGTPNRAVGNIVFLSATPFTEDTFQAYTLFQFLNAEKLAQVNLPALSYFYRMFAKEKYKADTNSNNVTGMFHVVDGYKNTYILSQLISSFCDFAVSDVEIDKKRPQKIILANTMSYPSNAGIDDADFSNIVVAVKEAKVDSLISMSEAQKKMAQDGNDYIAGRINHILRFTSADEKRANLIFEDILQWKAKTGYSTKDDAEMNQILSELDKYFTKKTSEKDGITRTYYELIDLTEVEAIENLIERGTQIDPANLLFQQYVLSYEASEDSDIDISDLETNESNSATGSGSMLKQITSRTMEVGAKSLTALVSPYFLTIDKKGSGFKKGENPYLPPLNYKDKNGSYVFDSFENAKTFVENSPKIYYTCEAIANQIKYQKERKEQVSGSIVYCAYMQFMYHGHKFEVFDLMSIYILGKYSELFLTDHLGASVEKLSFDEKKEKFFVQITGKTKEKGQVQQFNSGEAYVLFGTDKIKEGVDLQKNSAFLYILTVGYVPVTFMQLHGRMWRQGNPFKYCFIVNVLVKTSIDAFQYSKLDQKIQAVKSMLESGVYDVNETQFDVDVNDIKYSLISDPKILAELQYVQVKEKLTKQISAWRSQAEVLPILQGNLQDVLPDYKSWTEFIVPLWNDFSSVNLFLEVEEKRNSLNKDVYGAAKNSIADKIFAQQFTDKDADSDIGKAEIEENLKTHKEMRDQRQKMTDAQWEQKKNKKEWKNFEKIKDSIQIGKSLSDTDPIVISVVENIGLTSREEAEKIVLNKGSRGASFIQKFQPYADGYLPYTVYDKFWQQMSFLYMVENRDFIDLTKKDFINDYNQLIDFVSKYKQGLVTDSDMSNLYRKKKDAIYQAVFVVYILMPLSRSEYWTKDVDYSTINVDDYLDKYVDPETGKVILQSALTRVKRSLPVEDLFRRLLDLLDTPINDDRYKKTLNSYEQFIRSRGVNGEDIGMDELPSLSDGLYNKIEEAQSIFQRPAETKAKLAEEFAARLKEKGGDKDLSIDEKVKQLSLLYPLVKRK